MATIAVARRLALRSSSRGAVLFGQGNRRTLAMKARELDPTLIHEPLPPNYTIESVPPPRGYVPPQPPTPDPDAVVRKPVTSAHAIDLSSDPPKLSARDSAAIGPNGTVVHGRYGELDPDVAGGIPLEYLALLRPAAEGAAGVRSVLSSAEGLGKDVSSGGSTILVYGASRPAGMAAVQLASTSGHAVVGVVDGRHAGSDDMVDHVKNFAREPGTAVAEEYALVKSNFRDLVRKTSGGEDDDPKDRTTDDERDPETFLEEFKVNFKEYAATYPDTLPAAVDRSYVEFKGKEKDRDTFRANMDAYLSQFPKGCAPVDPAKLDAYFTVEQYAAFKAKFGVQTTAVVTGDEDVWDDFDPPGLVQKLVASPERPPPPAAPPVREEEEINDDGGAVDGPFVPYEFSVLQQNYASDLEVKKGGPIAGAVICVTDELKSAAEAVENGGPTTRGRAEALQFLTDGERNAYAAARSVAECAREEGGTVVVVGGTLPGLETVEPTDEDVQEALSAMELGDDGISDARLNYFLQIYRAGDYPVYADYAIHRAQEALSGPRQIVVTK